MKDARHGYIQPIGDVMKEVMPEIEAIAKRASENPRPDPTPEELKAAEVSQWYADAPKIGVWPRFLEANFETARPTQALEFTRAYMTELFPQGRALLLMGAPSIGKSYAAVAALRAAPKTSRRWWYFPDLVQFGEVGDEARALARRVYFAVFDDFGAEYFKKGGQFEAHIDALLAHRHGNLLPTIITTNLDRDDFRNNVSERIRERLVEWAKVYECTGQNLRRKE
jgi:DNA replication protein DnaC